MDDLVHHCLRELSFDGDLGSNVSRLKDFIHDFYTQPSAPHPQQLDEAFCGFVWSLVVKQPTVRVGTIPDGLLTEVWIAPQTSKIKKAKARGEEEVEAQPTELLPVPDAKERSLESLVAEFGDKLRIAVEQKSIYAAITGSHIRFSKLSPMVYSALQIITRGRATGVSVVSLGQKSGYDQKTCFYLVKQLQELNLVVKVRRPGVGTHSVIHRYFYEKSAQWKAILEEENEAEEAGKTSQTRNEETLEDERPSLSLMLDFTPIDARHLSSLPLVKARVVKLLKASKNYMHELNNMLLTLGFSNPTKTDRRFFQSRIRELIQQGIIEKVVVPSVKKKTPTSTVKCFRLVTSENKPDGVILDTQDDEDEEKAGPVESAGGVRMNATIHRQIIDILEESGTRGMTLNDLSIALSHFDKRTIELLLARADKVSPPPHLGDLGIVGLMETSGRERRHRYYTVGAYHRLLTEEQLEPTAGFADVDFDKAGEFAEVDVQAFYEDENALFHFQDSYKRNIDANTNPKRKRPLKNPILTDGSVKKGRPRKGISEVAPASKKRRIDGEDQNDNVEGATKIPKRRGRPLKNSTANEPISSVSAAAENAEGGTSISQAPPKRRGRPPKNSAANESIISLSTAPTNPEGNDTSISQASPKRRGRPPKKRPIALDADSNGNEEHQLKRKKIEITTSVEPAPSHPLNIVADGREVIELSPLSPLSQSQEDATETYTPIAELDIAVQNANTTEEFDIRAQDQQAVTEIPIDPVLMQEGTHVPLPIDAPNSSQVVSEKISPKKLEEKVLNTKGRVNVSQLRRENELYRVVENSGGVLNMQVKEFYQAHTALLETSAKAGEPASAPPGTRIDKRTASAAFDALEARGKVKQLRSVIQSHTGIQRSVRIIYLPHITEAQLKDYITELSRNMQPPSQTTSFLKINEEVEYGADSNSSSRLVWPLQFLQLEQPGSDKKERWSKNIARANQLFSYDDDIIRDVLLAERTTVGQLYGFIVGKMARIRELHLYFLHRLDSDTPSPNLVSKEERIIELSFFCQDMPLQPYTTFVSCLSHTDELYAFFSTAGSQTPVRDLPSSIHSLMQIGRSRARSRFLEMLEVLRLLGVVTPLQPVDSGETEIEITTNTLANHPTKFKHASLEGWSITTPMIAPSYWKFNAIAPVHAWYDSDTDPQFLKDIPIDTSETAATFWETLHSASVRTSIYDSERTSLTEDTLVNISLARSMRRSGSWSSEYVLTWHQTQYLKQFIDIHSARTPIEEPDETMKNEQLTRLCRVTSAPRDMVITFYQGTRTELIRELKKVKERSGRPNVDKRTRRNTEIKELLVRKAAEARMQREQEWDALLLRVHPGPLNAAATARVKRVQKRFLETGSTQEMDKWENNIIDAIREADMAKMLKMSNDHLIRPSGSQVSRFPPPTIVNPTEPSVQSLITRQGEPLSQKEQPKKKRKGKGKEKETTAGSPEVPTKISRRHRFQWNRDYDELARDAAAIIRARCRNASRVDWAAFEQVFPSVPRNTVRQRLTHIREAPGNEAFMNRLEEKWYELWIQHRGTPLLPDDDPQSASKFDLIKHVEFLRQHVDKNALRVGYGHTRDNRVILPSMVEDLLDTYEVDVTEPSGFTWDFMWNANVEEGREKRLMRQAFTKTLDQNPSSATEASSDSIALAEAVLKMTIGTPNERYSAEQGALILQSVGQKNVEAAAKGMLNRGILSKLVRDPQRSRPGRHLKISDMNLNTLGGSVPADTFQDAVALEELIAQDDGWNEWPLTATDGDCAAFIELVTEKLLDFRIDTSQAQAARQALDWNSKKADDDQIETAILYRRIVPPELVHDSTIDGNFQDEILPMADFDVEGAALSGHGITEDGEPATCRMLTRDSLIDCRVCIQSELSTLVATLGPESVECMGRIMEVVKESGASGIAIPMIQDIRNTPRFKLMENIRKLVNATVPLVYLTGYTTLVVVSASSIRQWSVKVANNPTRLVFPRRWLDIEGWRIMEFWEAALKAVLGLVVFRPGISQTEIRWRLRSTYDRQEVAEVTKHLLRQGFLRIKADIDQDDYQEPLPVDDHEERQLFFFTGNKRWYQT